MLDLDEPRTLIRRALDTRPQVESIQGPYFETYWLPVVGPSVFAIMRWLDRRTFPDTLSLRDVAERVGVRSSDAIKKTFQRMGHFRFVHLAVDDELWVVPAVRHVDERQLARLPEILQRTHHDLLEDLHRRAQQAVTR